MAEPFRAAAAVARSPLGWEWNISVPDQNRRTEIVADLVHQRCPDKLLSSSASFDPWAGNGSPRQASTSLYNNNEYQPANP